MLSRFSPYLTWAVLALPALPMLGQLAGADPARALQGIIHESGEWSARLMIIALMATPLMMLFKGWRGPRWLVRNRRYLGVASFAYATVHVVAYLWTESVTRIIADLTQFDMAMGWLAFIVFIPLAATSADWAVRALGPKWKTLQRWTYAAAVFVLLHWAALHDWRGVGDVLVNFGPLIALTMYRLWWNLVRVRPIAV
jgi:methionine sulfoxide reductase heme-binding subunit